MPKARTRFRNRRFDTFSQGILFGTGGRLLATTGSLQRFMLGLRSDGDGAPFVLLYRANTVDLARTAPAISGGELDLDHLIGSVVNGRSPADTVLPFGADRLLALPVDGELAGINALLRVGLPLHIDPSWTDDFNPVLLLATDQNRSRDIAGIEQVLTRGELCLLKIGMDRLRQRLIGCRSCGGSHMRDQMGGVFLARLGDMHFIAGPPRLALFA